MNHVGRKCGLLCGDRVVEASLDHDGQWVATDKTEQRLVDEACRKPYLAPEIATKEE